MLVLIFLVVLYVDDALPFCVSKCEALLFPHCKSKDITSERKKVKSHLIIFMIATFLFRLFCLLLFRAAATDDDDADD